MSDDKRELRPGAHRNPDGETARRVFLAGLGLTFVVAFLSLWTQVEGLFGERGIAPIADTMAWAEERGVGLLSAPTLFRIAAGDWALHLVLALGVLGGAALGFGLAPRWAALLAWACLLSFVQVGAPFLSFQWDVLLLEAGLLGALYVPGGLRPFRRGARPRRPPSAVLRFLFAWLLVRLVLGSGVVKLASGDVVWRDGTALAYHFWTQPLPHALAHYVHHLPLWVGRASVLAMFAVEFLAPLLLFFPWRARRFGMLAICALMAGFAGTGNYGFFQLLTLVLCLPLVDDLFLARWGTRLRVPYLRSGCLDTGEESERAAPGPRARRSRLRTGLELAFAAFVVAGTAWRAGWIDLPRPAERLAAAVEPLHSFNRYGLFADMTETRPEIVLEASTDGRTWREVRFRYKPTDPAQAPRFAGLHMPRLDWQLWFAALRGEPPSWYFAFVQRVLEGSPAVLALLDEPDSSAPPPRYLRSTLYEYRFSTPEERRAGRWWAREPLGPFWSALTLGADGKLRTAFL